MSVANAIFPKSFDSAKTAFVWGAPAIAIPGLRYTQDNHRQRNELFVRDASTYTIGALTYYVGDILATKTFTRYQNFLSRFQWLNKDYKLKFTAFLIGLSANLLYAGIGAVHVSHAIARRQAKSKETKVNTSFSPDQTISAQQTLLIQPMEISPFSISTPSLMYPPNEPSLNREKQVEYFA